MEKHVQTEEHRRSIREPKFIGRRIVGQCNTADFRHLEHLADVLAYGGEIDTSNLSNKQKMAVLVLRHFQKSNVPFKVLLKLREIIVWDLNPGIGFEYKLLDPRDKETHDILKNMRR